MTWWNPKSWTRAGRRSLLLSRPVDPAWHPWFERLPFWGGLSGAQRALLIRIARLLVHDLPFEGCGGLQLTDEIRVTIAAQAALLLLGLDDGSFAKVPAVLVYPQGFRNPNLSLGSDGLLHEAAPNLGEAWLRGPVILSWTDVLASIHGQSPAHNLVLHEFAHKLDMLDGFADGRPPLHSRVPQHRWHAVLLREFDALREAAEHGRSTLLDTYGARNPAEFFAVATELFFGLPLPMRARHPELYQVLASYYGQDPARRAEPHQASSPAHGGDSQPDQVPSPGVPPSTPPRP